MVTQLDLEAIRLACERHGVQRLRVFGSALSDRFDPDRSDIDFLVDFLPTHGDMFDDYFGLREALTEIVAREVVLILARSIRKPLLQGVRLQQCPGCLCGPQDVYAA